MYRRSGAGLEVLLVHPGGPYWRRKDAGAWSIPKGEVDGEEDASAVASREFAEETGVALADRPLEPLGEIRQLAPSKAILTFTPSGATRLRSNGRREAARCSHSRRSIARNGLTSLRHGPGFSKASGRCSIALPSLSANQERRDE